MSGKKPKNDRRMQSEPAASRKDRILSNALSEYSVSSSSVQLSGYTKRTLMGMQNAKDPFSRDAEEAIEEFHNYVMNFPSHVGVNLEECALLLQSSTKLFGRQVKDASKCVADLAAFVTNTMTKEPDEDEEKEKKNRKKHDTEKTAEEVAAAANQNPSDNGESTSLVRPSGVVTESTGVNETGVSTNEATTLGDQTGESSLHHHDGSTAMKAVEDGTAMISDSTTGVNTGDSAEMGDSNLNLTSNSACDISQSASLDETGQSTINNGEGTISSPPDQVNSDNPADVMNPFTLGHTTSQIILSDASRKRQAKEKGEGSVPKKARLNGLLPPTLVSIFDLDEELEEADDEIDDFPPVLFPEVDLWNGQFDLEADPDAPDRLVLLMKAKKLKNSSITNNDNSGNTQAGNLEGTTQPLTTPSDESQAETMAAGMSDNLLASSDVTQVNGIVLPETDNPGGFPVLAPEDQQEIQNCINQLHYLPFTCELSKEELARTFHNTVEHLETIFKKYNLPFNRQLLKAASVVCANMVSSFSNSPTNGFQPPLNQETLNSFREIFSQGSNGLREETLKALVNSGKTVLERTKEKSVAESRATLQKRLYEMQRLIVPKYIQLPLITENTPGFFRRVKQFEQKMKKVLADEEKKDTFDVSKYEIEVLAATADLESQEDEFGLMDDSSEDTNASSSQNSTILQDFIMDDLPANVVNDTQRMMMPGMFSPTSASNSPSSCDFGKKWVPLSNVFNHMKKFDRNECARHFYAVLALLSSQNLDMNYDRHFSAESAAFTTKLDHSQDGKYPRGVKIMTSRCPDADKEEIYVTALASKSCNETFRDLISHEMTHLRDHEHQNEAQTSGLSRTNSRDYDSDDEEFIPMNCSMSHTGNLFGGRKKRTN